MPGNSLPPGQVSRKDFLHLHPPLPGRLTGESSPHATQPTAHNAAVFACGDGRLAGAQPLSSTAVKPKVDLTVERSLPRHSLMVISRRAAVSPALGRPISAVNRPFLRSGAALPTRYCHDGTPVHPATWLTARVSCSYSSYSSCSSHLAYPANSAALRPWRRQGEIRHGTRPISPY